MKRLFVPLFAVSLILAVLAPPAAADLASEVQAVAQDRTLARAALGVYVARLGSSSADFAELHNRDGETPFIPASNLKVITTAAAVDRLGADFKFRTVLVRAGEDLVLVGDGDPNFGDAEYLRKVGWKTTTVFEGWAQQLNKLNLTTFRDLIIDDGVFDQDFFHPRWPPNQWDARYEAQVGGLNLNANCVDMLVSASSGERAELSLDPPTRYLAIANSATAGGRGPLVVSREFGTNKVTVRGAGPSRGVMRAWATVHDPSLFTGAVLAETLAAGGIRVTGTVRRDRTFRPRLVEHVKAGQWSVVGLHETPLATVLARANKDSVNLYAESLCKRMGYELARASGAESPAGSWTNGAEAIGDFLKRSGVAETEFKLDDGSGLSRQNAISPRAIARVLASEYYGKNREMYVASLSVAGSDGTLEDRFRNTDVRQRVFGKSGYIDGVSTLCGLLRGRDGQWYAFSIMMNGIPAGSNGVAKQLQERIVRAIEG